ncbi:RagB/SusD family nutrient uptake outer membrane protein [Paraflavitalea speifideaquila]|uniref:RagB/SusD family nutrient uptake outer membrane protein n=1 Tax=Paraflavitalea speifideaquila TaxID=3076558 RepID=UPI0028E67655|nr:RagB/SusD family nutrient uptake outer membrane protein [Paraflavitalea speifideiaquila]
MIDSIYKDLDWAVANLEQIDAQAAADYGRVTITAAQALKAKVALFEGTRQKFHNYGTPSKHLQIAVDASKAVIDGGKHALYKFNKVTVPDSSYYNLFQMAADGKTNKEAILVRLYGADLTNRISVHNIARSLEQGGTTPTRNLVDAYLYKDGLPFNKSVHDSTTPSKQIRTLSQFSNRDFRMGQTIFNRTSFFLTGNYNPTYLFSPSGYKTMKYFNQVDWQNQAGFADFQIIRYAEVLLTYAEALYELNGAITDADLDKSINLTRARAGLPKLTNAFATANTLDLREEIRRERRVELAFEGNRYWDIMRWKTAEIELPNDIVGAKHIQAEYGNLPANTTLTADGFVIVQKAANRKFEPARDYLFPLPTQQLALQPALTQNDNWR